MLHTLTLNCIGDSKNVKIYRLNTLYIYWNILSCVGIRCTFIMYVSISYICRRILLIFYVNHGARICTGYKRSNYAVGQFLGSPCELYYDERKALYTLLLALCVLFAPGGQRYRRIHRTLKLFTTTIPTANFSRWRRSPGAADAFGTGSSGKIIMKSVVMVCTENRELSKFV